MDGGSLLMGPRAVAWPRKSKVQKSYVPSPPAGEPPNGSDHRRSSYAPASSSRTARAILYRTVTISSPMAQMASVMDASGSVGT